MSADPLDDALAQASAGASRGDPLDDALAQASESPGKSKPQSRATQASVLPLNFAAGGLIAHELSGVGASGIAGVRSVYDLAKGVPPSEVDKRNQKFIADHTYQPADPTARSLDQAFESNANPLNWIGKGFDVLGETINRATDPSTWSRIMTPSDGNPLLASKAGGMPIGGMPAAPLPTTGGGSTALGPILSGIGQVALGAAPLVGEVGLPKVPTARDAPGWGREAAARPDAPSSSPDTSDLNAGPGEIPGRPGVAIDTEPVEGGLPDAAARQRGQILQRVGFERARDSAIEGNAQNAATDWQLSKFDEPAGMAAKNHFEGERQTMQQFAQGIVERTGGTLGTDEDSLNIRGQTIARPFDALSDWFDTQRQKLYAAADQRSGGHPVVQPLSLQSLLEDRSFQNQLTARDQMHIRNGVSSELTRFQEGNPGALTVQNAEQFRQFLNTLWTPENSSVIGRLKGALDDDVMKGAGEDLYGPARQLSRLEKQTLENPSGINKLMERDPQTPINRRTSFDKIPDTLTRLAPAQFDNVLRTLQTMPTDVQPEAQAAIAEIKAHLANKIYDAGNSTSGQWNARGVEKAISANSAKLQSAFEDQPGVLGNIQDLRSAGNILSVNQSYPGAAAQAANALKRGLMSQAFPRVGGIAGAGAGGILGPWGAVGGAAAGEAVGRRVGQSVAERSAQKAWEKKVSSLSDLAGQ